MIPVRVSPDDTGSRRLSAEIAALYAGRPDGAGLVSAFRDAVVLVPTDPAGQPVVVEGPERASVWRWVPVFTGRAALAGWARARYGGERERGFRSVRGWRLADVVGSVTTVQRPVGIAIDVAGPTPVLLPPVRGIAPDEVALDIGQGPALPRQRTRRGQDDHHGYEGRDV